jgi:3-hydroxy-9,10-secoandrosta-1,3,5(10)-triene-9,17-dione monooxygenase
MADFSSEAAGRNGTAEALAERARALAPALREQAARAEKDRRLPDETHRAFTDAGFYRIFQPARFGGAELPYPAIVDIAAELGRGCGSSAWVFTNLAQPGLINGMKDPRAQEELWADNPDTLCATAHPGASSTVTKVDGGIVVDGAWHAASGIDFADWVNLQVFLRPEGGPAEHRFAMLPKSDCAVVDDWFVTGMSATGSRSIRMEEVFIPDYRMIGSLQMRGGPTPGSVLNPGPLYRLPFWSIAGRQFAAPAIGIARGALDLTEMDIESRKGAGGASLSEEPVVHLRLSESDAEIEAAYALALRDCVTATRMTEAGTLPDALQRVRWKRNNAYAVLLCVRAVDRLYDLAGMRGMAPESHVQRAWRDVHAVACQVSVAWNAQAANYGRARFGLPIRDPRI